MPRRPLPWFKGPKLAPFAFRDETNPQIDFIRHLGSGLHSAVFEAAIDGRRYAVKLFRFAHPLHLAFPDLIGEGLISGEDVLRLKDPFYCECRAYGRLKEAGREDLAVRSFGYVLLTPEQEEQAGGVRDVAWDRRPADQAKPVRGIVKELCDGDAPPFTFEMLPRMREDVLALNSLGIVVWDLREDNYMGGRVIDFSQAITAPHLQLRSIYRPMYYQEGARFTAAAYGRRKHARGDVSAAKDGLRSRGGVEPLGRRGMRKKWFLKGFGSKEKEVWFRDSP